MVYAIDGRERWLVHNYLKPAETDFDSVDPRRVHPHIPASERTSTTTSSPGKTVRTAADCEQVSRPQHRARRCGAYLGALRRIWHERRDCRRMNCLAACGSSQWLGAGFDSRCYERSAAITSRCRGSRCRMRKPKFAAVRGTDDIEDAGSQGELAPAEVAVRLRNQRPAICLRRSQFVLLRSAAVML